MVSCMVAYPLIHRLTGIETANGISATRQAPQFLVELHIDIFVLLHSDSPLTRIVFLFYFAECHFLQEWPHDAYPPWAHGPGYIISRDIAKFIVRGHQERDLKVNFS